MMSRVKNMSRWTMNAHQQFAFCKTELDNFGDSSVAVCFADDAMPAPALGDPWTCPDPVCYDEDEEDEDEDEVFGDDEEFADDEEYDEEDDDFLEDEDEELDDEESEDEEDDDDEF